MGVLTESMTRLRDEIATLRRSRQRFRSELARSRISAQLGVVALRRAWASDLAGARQAWRGEEEGPGAPRGRQAAHAGHVCPANKRKK